MHCFICVTYVILLTSATPLPTRELTEKHDKRSLFHDVIQSLRIRSQLAEESIQNEDNNLSLNYGTYGYENEALQMPGDADFLPRRNDRVEMPRLKYRFPKSLDTNASNDNKEEIVLYIQDRQTTEAPKPTKTQKPKKPQGNKNTPNKQMETVIEDVQSTENYTPLTNNMGGQSQIGHRESQTVIKPTVIVNIRGTVTHTDGQILLERKGNNQTLDIPRNVFNINQEINLGTEPFRKTLNKVKQDVKFMTKGSKIEEDMMMCESAYKMENDQIKEKSHRDGNVMQILFSI